MGNYNITRPTLLIDEQKCMENIMRMVHKTTKSDVRLRAHFKTHQSAHIGEWFRSQGIVSIAVSSVKMAVYFANHNWDDITIAFPFNIHEIPVINSIDPNVSLQLTFLSPEVVEKTDARLSRAVEAMIKIDTGYNRTGIAYNDAKYTAEVYKVIQQSENITFRGFLAHAGHSYYENSKDMIHRIHRETIDRMVELRSNYPDAELSIGDTPCCSIEDDFTGVTEIRPGNFVFYDIAQYYIGSCSVDQIATCLAVPVIATHPKERKIVVHGGAVHLSKDHIMMDDGTKNFGQVVELDAHGWGKPLTDWAVSSLSQEHGILVTTNDKEFKKFNVGDFMGIIPVHSCLTADAMKGYLTLEGKTLEHLEGTNYR